ncbi:hypothetical protein GCM10017673_38140 [Streptosporangium violaceochromogenes]|nr:hypothetical protein GCM10017673_38140 [Streptosporangium violaceochromogenes]
MTTKTPETLAAVRDLAETVASLDRQLAAVRASLRRAIIAADADGHSRNSIALAARGGLSRGKVFETLPPTRGR